MDLLKSQGKELTKAQLAVCTDSVTVTDKKTKVYILLVSFFHILVSSLSYCTFVFIYVDICTHCSDSCLCYFINSTFFAKKTTYLDSGCSDDSGCSIYVLVLLDFSSHLTQLIVLSLSIIVLLILDSLDLWQGRYLYLYNTGN